MHILAVAHEVPHGDRSAGELRLVMLLALLATRHNVFLYCSDKSKSTSNCAHTGSLAQQGISIVDGPLVPLLRRQTFDIVFFEFYYAADRLIDTVRSWQPAAKIVIDSVDIHFNRLRSKARLTGSSSDFQRADAVCRAEVSVYARADAVVVVSCDEGRALKKEGVRAKICVLPTIHEMFPLGVGHPGDRLEIVFVGCYLWQPNVDAMVYFCREVMPLIKAKVPSVRLRILGSSPTTEIRGLTTETVEVLGYVEDLAAYLAPGVISIAPLRYGGGIKGKIAEAMAHGVPVVTTTTGTEGFGFAVGEHVLVGDTPQEFSDAVISLWSDHSLYDKIRENGWRFIEKNYSVDAMISRLPSVLAEIARLRPKRPSLSKIFAIRARHMMERHLLWRLRSLKS